MLYLQMLSTEQERKDFEALYLRYRNLMLSIAYKILPEMQDAEDAVHQAFLSIIKHLDKLPCVDCPETRAYIVTIVERKALDILRSQKKLRPLEELPQNTASVLPSDTWLSDTLAQLPARYRHILLLRFAYGYSTRELAQEFHMTQGSVQKLLWRAKEALEKQLKEEV